MLDDIGINGNLNKAAKAASNAVNAGAEIVLEGSNSTSSRGKMGLRYTG
jgi:hypothetical protein